MQITENYCELMPAYNRDYKSKKEVELAFREGKDFSGDYKLKFALCSIRDFAPKTNVLLRYKRNTQIAAITV